MNKTPHLARAFAPRPPAQSARAFAPSHNAKATRRASPEFPGAAKSPRPARHRAPERSPQLPPARSQARAGKIAAAPSILRRANPFPPPQSRVCAIPPRLPPPSAPRRAAPAPPASPRDSGANSPAPPQPPAAARMAQETPRPMTTPFLFCGTRLGGISKLRSARKLSGVRKQRSAMQFVQQTRRRKSRLERNRNHAPAARLNLFTSGDRFDVPVRAFRQNVRPQSRQKFARRRSIEHHNVIHRRETCQNRRAIFLRQHRPRRPLQSAHTRVAVQSHHQTIPQRARLFEALNMSGMQQIETSVGEHHSPPIAVFRPQLDNQFVFGDDLAQANAALRFATPAMTPRSYTRATRSAQLLAPASQFYHASFSA